MSTKTNLLRAAVALSFVLAFASNANAAIVATWTFETSLPNGTGAANGPWAAEVGAGSASGLHASAATVWSNPAGNGTAESYSANTWAIGDYFQFQVSTVGLEDVMVSWDQTRSGTGPTTFDFQYSTDGSTFTTSLNDYAVVSAPAWNAGTNQPGFTFVQDLSAITALDNQATVFFRIVSDIAAAAAGTGRVDTFSVQATPVPEPTSMALAGIGLAGFIGNRLRRRKAAKAN